jgi:peptide/nickel transport system substrate-binding protein
MNGFSQNLISYGKEVSLGLKELKNITLSRLWKVFSLMGKKEKIALGLLALVATLSFVFSVRNFYIAHTSPSPAEGGSYNEGLLGQPTYINPLLAHDEPDLSLTNLIYSGLYKYDNKGQITPDLADSMPVISQDQKQYTIILKQNVKWHNGKTFSADDVVFTIQTLQDPNYKSPLRALWSSTLVEKLSDYSIKLTTRDISGPFINKLTLPILPKSVWNQVDGQHFLLSNFNLAAIGTGPYAIKEIKKLPSGKIEQISLEAFGDYFAGRAKIQRLTFEFYDTEEDILNAFHSREIQGFGFIPLGSSLYIDKKQDNAQVITAPLPQYQVVFFNLNNKILSDQNVRTALSLATNKQQIIDQVFKGNALLPISPFLFNTGENKTIDSKTDINQAKTLLDNSDWKVDTKTGIRTNKKGAPLEITLATNDSLVNSNAAGLLADQWKKLNIKVNLSILPSKQLNDKLIKPRAFDALLFPQKFGADPDPFLFWHSSQVKDPGFNLTGFVDTNADKLLIDARTTTDKAKRDSDYQQFNNLITTKTPIIIIDQTEYIYATDSDIKNVNFNTLYDPSYRFDNISNWYISEKRVWKK